MEKKRIENQIINQADREKTAVTISVVTIIVNMALFIVKLFAGFAAASSAMISDAVHSASDVFSTIVVIAGIKIAGKTADDSHPYGHERFEGIASLTLAIILAVTGLGIGWSGVQKIAGVARGTVELGTPGRLALAAAVLSIVVKEGMYWYTRKGARKIDSDALMADAWHHRSDALSSVGSFVGILGARVGFPLLDPLASIVICAFIAKAAYEIFLDSIHKLTDSSCDESTLSQMKEMILKHEAVFDVDDIKTRMFGSKLYVDVEICADGSQSLASAHDIAHQIHDQIEEEFPQVKHCMIHVNPAAGEEICGQ